METSRYLAKIIQNDALNEGKMAFISGPRQVGKTTLARQFLSDKKNYFSWDDVKFKRQWVKNPSYFVDDLDGDTIVLDEIHKYRTWKGHLKGLYDQSSDQLKIIVTGSARLDIYRRGGDSLLGRYLPFRLHPFSVGESEKTVIPSNFFIIFSVSFLSKLSPQ